MSRPTSIRSTTVRVAAVVAATAFAASSWAPAALAADGDVQVVNTETIQVYTDASGEVQTKRVYEQLAMTGNGTVDLSNPIETDGLRNLDSFAGFDVQDGNQITKLTVDGEKHLRSVSNYGGDLPLEVNVQYLLDGAAVEPGDVVGAEGDLEVIYTVKNVTGTPQEVSFDDGQGGTATKTVDVPIPMVGSLTTTVPENFTQVASKQANMAGDGKGGTKLSFTMTLFPPIGSDTAEFGYTAKVTDGIVPRSDITALPLNPLQSPTFASAGKSYQGGADTGIELADGATQIDTNLLKLRDGASDLLAGLIKLRDGSNQLYLGLAGTAVPGARKLADGMGQLDDGLGKLSSGSGELAAGATKASDGSKLLRAGAGKLSGGLGDLSGGALQLDNGAGKIVDGQKALRDGLLQLEAGVKTLPDSVREQLATNDSYQALLGGMQKVVDGIGQPSDVTNPATGQPATLFGGLNAIRGGLLTQVKPGLQSAIDGVPAKKASLGCASAILTQLAGGAAAPAACGATGLPAVGVGVDPATAPAPVLGAIAAQKGALGNIATGLTASIGDLDTLAAGLGQVVGAIDTQFVPAIDKMKAGLYNPNANPLCSVGAATATTADDCGAQQAIAFFKVSIPILVDSITASISQTLLAGISAPSTGCDPKAMTLLCGANALVAGTKDLKGGTAKLLAGSGELDAGGLLIYQKLGELSAGLGKISDGAGQLSDGAATAKDGSGQLADGSNQLADGLGSAADGSRQIADGLTTAADGAPKLVDGAQRLSTEGTKKLVKAGEDTAQNYGQMFATIEAGAKRADAEKMAYGAPEGAIGLTAYSFIIQGEDGEGGRNLARGLSGLALIGAGAGAFALRRKFI